MPAREDAMKRESKERERQKSRGRRTRSRQASMLATIAERSAISDQRFAAPVLGRFPMGASLLGSVGVGCQRSALLAWTLV